MVKGYQVKFLRFVETRKNGKRISSEIFEVCGNQKEKFGRLWKIYMGRPRRDLDAFWLFGIFGNKKK
jgi:hypothetical protein